MKKSITVEETSVATLDDSSMANSEVVVEESTAVKSTVVEESVSVNQNAVDDSHMTNSDTMEGFNMATSVTSVTMSDSILVTSGDGSMTNSTVITEDVPLIQSQTSAHVQQVLGTTNDILFHWFNGGV